MRFRDVGPQDHVLGPPSAPAAVMFYGDFECPYSKQAYRVVTELAKWYGNLICVTFRHFPLTECHPNSRRAAEASEAAHSQGLFWKMQACLFENQQLLDRQHLVRYASVVGLDVRRFTSELDAGQHRRRVEYDVNHGAAIGVNTVPSLFVNGKPVAGLDYDDAYELVEEALRSKAMYLVARTRRRAIKRPR